MTARTRCRPTFLVIGAQKAGTTSLHAYLAQHPSVRCASLKEVSYFHRYYDRGESWYLAHFPLRRPRSLLRRRIDVPPAVGEATAAYFFDPRVPQRVHAFDPCMKLIVVLRDPVERAHSHYEMERRWGRELLSFEEALDREERELPTRMARMLAAPNGYDDLVFSMSYIARGRYAQQLERWLELFPSEQLLVLTSDELLRGPSEAVCSVARFLGIRDWQIESFPRRGVQKYSPMAPATRERLAQIFDEENMRVQRLLGRPLHWTRPATSVSSDFGNG